ncbi:MAG: 60S ribosomal export protein NMD3, partial [Thermoplasmata archaeon]|nr:60S ribosomal export protein NMD3 [Thermoplasmata archaeon]
GRPLLPGAADLLPLLLAHPEASIRTVDWTDASVHPLMREVDGVVHLRFRGMERTEPVRLTVKIEHRTCPTCSRRAGHFYAATIQLRGGDDAPREKAPARRERLQQSWASVLHEIRAPWKSAISWTEDLPEGIDLYLTDVLSARSIARVLKRALGARLVESATLWGRKNGKDVYRVTFCARVPMVRPDHGPSRSDGSVRRAGRSQPRVER